MTLSEIIRGLVEQAEAKGPVVRMSEVAEAAKPHLTAHPVLAEALMMEGLQQRVKNHLRRRASHGAA
jgi:hypothetical protein